MWEELLRWSLAGPTLITSEAVRLRTGSVLILRDGMGGMNLVVLLASNSEDWFFLSNALQQDNRAASFLASRGLAAPTPGVLLGLISPYA